MKTKSLIESFKYALQGIYHGIKKERNFKIHMVFVILVIIMSFILKINKTELIILSITISMVLSAELFNTALENAIDLICGDNINPLAKIAKDCSAGAVLITAINSVIVGFIIFFDKLINFIGL